MGEYKQGADPLADEAIRKIDAIRTFLKQRTDELVPLNQTISQLQQIVGY